MSVISIGISPVLSYCPAHAHAAWEIVLNLQSEGIMKIGSESFNYKPGTIICQPPNVPHAKYCNGQFRDVFLETSSLDLLDGSGKRKVLVFQDDSEKSFETLMLMANRVYHRNEKNYSEITNSLCEVMENILLSWSQNSSDNLEVEKLKNILAGSFTNPELSMDKLLFRSGYCADHLRRLFKKATGLTPLDYLTQLRLNYAKRLLSKNGQLNYSIAEIGMMSGFYDINYFSRVFKKHTGKSPTEYFRFVSRQ